MFVVAISSIANQSSLGQTTETDNDQVDETIELRAVSGLKFDKVRLVAQPGTTLRITLTNADEMMHNMLIVRPDTRMEVVKQAESLGEKGAALDYVPQTENVLADTPLLGPGETASIIFEVPDEEAVYPYVCTYPAHGVVMYGALYATNNPDEIPPLDEDPNIPEPVRNQMASSSSMHPYPMDKPVLARLFMPEASPAAIAVGMENKQSYTWDAGYSFLRYAWSGGYIDASEQWDAKAHETADIIGEVYYRNTSGFPFRVGRRDSVPKPEFKGYKLIEGYPQFKYRMGDIVVNELIKPAEQTPGFRIEYQLENVKTPIWYAINSENNNIIEPSRGQMTDGMLQLTAKQARQFSVTVTAN